MIAFTEKLLLSATLRILTVALMLNLSACSGSGITDLECSPEAFPDRLFRFHLDEAKGSWDASGDGLTNIGGDAKFYSEEVWVYAKTGPGYPPGFIINRNDLSIRFMDGGGYGRCRIVDKADSKF